MRLIDADAFIQMMEEKCDPESTLDPWVLSVCRGGAKMMPTVDAVPVRHGRWIRVYSRPGVFKYLGWTCDQCGQRTGNEYAPQWYKFCPNCGARMDGDGK